MLDVQDDTHLLRVRIKKNVLKALKQMAQEESERAGATVTVSDLARCALTNHLRTHESKQKLLRANTMQPDLLILIQPPTAPRFQESSEADQEKAKASFAAYFGPSKKVNEATSMRAEADGNEDNDSDADDEDDE